MDNFQQEERDYEFLKARREYRAIRDNCLELKIKFTDPDFPAAQSSLLGGKSSSSTGKQKNGTDRKWNDDDSDIFSEKFRTVASWRRPDGISLTGRGNDKSGDDWKLINKEPQPSDICQGSLGNCWFIAALALIAERKDLLAKILITRKFNSVGVYALRLFKDGQWKGVVVDDLFPCDNYDRLAFSSCRGKQLWVPLIEKAMSKLCGGYAFLQSGQVSEGLNYLTGFVSERITIEQEKDRELLWARLLSFHSAEFVMGAHITTSDESVTENYKDMGLVTNHEYSLLKVVCMENHRLVQLRNPWGRFSWKGDWSDNSPLWTQDMSDFLSPYGSEEGIFWMGYHDFINIFTGMEVCKIRQNWTIYTLDGILPPGADPDCQPCFEVVCEESCEVDISLYQGCKRSAVETVEKTDIGLMILETKKSSKGFKFVKPVELTRSAKQHVVTCNLILTAGNYCLVPFSFGHWTEKENENFYTFALTIHSSRELAKFAPVTNIPPNILAKALISCSKYYGDRHDSPLANGIATITMGLGSGYCTILENNTKDQYVELEMEYTTNGNYVSTRDAFKSRDRIPPSHCQVVQMLTIKDPVKQSSYRSSSQLRASQDLNQLTLKKEKDGDLAHLPKLTERILGLHKPIRCHK